MRGLTYVDIKYMRFCLWNEIGGLILYSTKIILGVQNKAGKHCKYFCLLHKNFR